MAASPPSLGIIAGNRQLPLVLAREARRLGVGRIVAVGFEGETDPSLGGLVDELVWLKVGQLNKLIAAFTDRNVRHCVMVGQISPQNLFDLRPDFRAMTLLLKLREKNAHTIFGAIGAELAKDGIELISAVPWLEPVMPGGGYQAGPSLADEQWADLRFGFRIAKEVARLEIGQLVVVKNGTVLAVEGFEGTDRCLTRGGELAGKNGGAVAVKLARKNHDLRFDIPCIGLRTLEVCASSGIRVLGFETKRTLLLDREASETMCRQAGVTLIALESEQPET